MATVRQWKKKLYKQVEEGIKEWKDVLGLTYTVFEKAPDVLKVTKEDEGKRIWIAGKYKTHKAYIKEYRSDDEITINLPNSKKYKTLVKEQMLLHPSEVDQERLEKFEYEIKDGRKS